MYETSGVQDLREEMVLQVRSIAQCNEVVVCATAQYWDYGLDIRPRLGSNEQRRVEQHHQAGTSLIAVWVGHGCRLFLLANNYLFYTNTEAGLPLCTK